MAVVSIATSSLSRHLVVNSRMIIVAPLRKIKVPISVSVSKKIESYLIHELVF